MSQSATAYIGLGGNVDDAARTLRLALAALNALPQTQLIRASRLYRTPAWGKEDQADFVNAVAMARTQLAAPALLQALLRIERNHGRERAGGHRWGPRTLDLDLLLYEQQRIELPGLRVPHPYLHQRAFVLVPLLEIDPDVCIPGIGSARKALQAMDSEQIIALD